MICMLSILLDVYFLCKSLNNAHFSLQGGSLWGSDAENSCDVENTFLKILSLAKRVQGVAVLKYKH